MTKRYRDGSLTGGTGDVSPQFLSIAATQSGADTSTTTSFSIPVQRLPTGARAQVMEVLKIFFMAGNTQVEVDNTVNCFLSTTSFGTTATTISEPRVFAAWSKQLVLTTSGEAINVEPIIQDLTDGAGHGILIATDQIFAQVNSATTSVANTVRMKIMYRWKNVPLAEYIGIVQSQQ